MATPKLASRQVAKLDPTWLAASKALRRPSPEGREIQGDLRNPKSRAAKHWQEQESARLKKALKHVSHGKNIFAYNHLRTNQVVYSLTRVLDFRNVLDQLVFHRKKSIPAQLRNDMWIPYFSVHFSSAAVGLHAYQLLREFSMQRQLAPPKEMITHTEEDINRMRPRDPLEAKEFDKAWKHRIGQIMDKKHRARVLMDQKATSVADIAAVLAIQETEFADKLGQEVTDEQKMQDMSNRAAKRLQKARKMETQKEQQIQERLETVRGLVSSGELAAADLIPENNPPEEEPDVDVPAGQVRILWKDIHDAVSAESWPESVRHGELEDARPRLKHIIGGEKVPA